MIRFLRLVTSFHVKWFVMKMAPRATDLFILKHRKQLKELLKKYYQFSDYQVAVLQFVGKTQHDYDISLCLKYNDGFIC